MQRKQKAMLRSKGGRSRFFPRYELDPGAECRRAAQPSSSEYFAAALRFLYPLFYPLFYPLDLYPLDFYPLDFTVGQGSPSGVAEL